MSCINDPTSFVSGPFFLKHEAPRPSYVLGMINMETVRMTCSRIHCAAQCAHYALVGSTSACRGYYILDGSSGWCTCGLLILGGCKAHIPAHSVLYLHKELGKITMAGVCVVCSYWEGVKLPFLPIQWYTCTRS